MLYDVITMFYVLFTFQVAMKTVIAINTNNQYTPK